MGRALTVSMSRFTTFVAMTFTFLVVGFTTASVVCAQSKTCNSLVASAGSLNESKYPINDQWRNSGTTAYRAFRANAPYYWSYVSKSTNIPSSLKRAVSYKGTIAGDLHIQNVNMVEYPGGERKFQLVDLDDGGNGSFLLDFARAALGIQLSPFSVSTPELWRAYVSGLRGEKLEKPRVLKKAEAKSESDFVELQATYLEKMTFNDRFTSEALLRPLREMDPKTRELFNFAEQTFLAQVSPARVLDVGFYVKDTGGSQGVPRFWYLIKHPNGKNEIVEFKAMAEPATNLHETQENQRMRFAELERAYRSAGPVGRYQVVEIGPYQFIVRTRFKSFLKLNPEKIEDESDIRDGQDVSLFLANRLGRWHGAQASAAPFIREINAHETELATSFQSFLETLSQDIRSHVQP